MDLNFRTGGTNYSLRMYASAVDLDDYISLYAGGIPYYVGVTTDLGHGFISKLRVQKEHPTTKVSTTYGALQYSIYNKETITTSYTIPSDAIIISAKLTLKGGSSAGAGGGGGGGGAISISKEAGIVESSHSSGAGGTAGEDSVLGDSLEKDIFGEVFPGKTYTFVVGAGGAVSANGGAGGRYSTTCNKTGFAYSTGKAGSDGVVGLTGESSAFKENGITLYTVSGGTSTPVSSYHAVGNTAYSTPLGSIATGGDGGSAGGAIGDDGTANGGTPLASGAPPSAGGAAVGAGGKGGTGGSVYYPHPDWVATSGSAGAAGLEGAAGDAFLELEFYN